ncbi:MAG TPA: cupredoxin domain-containing protein [Myxococcaceae bacterium]|nr:cupredoxin domain-containing protein [Myxococcaceae bacterium]
MKDISKLVKAALAVTFTAFTLLAAGSAFAATSYKQSAEKPAPAKTDAKADAKGTAKDTAKPAKEAAKQPRTIEMKVTGNGYEPDLINVKKGEPLKLVITRVTDETCATNVEIDEHNVKVDLPLNKPVEVAFTPTKSGQLKYGCSMGKMISGVILVE